MTFASAFVPPSALRPLPVAAAAEAPSRAADPALDRAVARAVETFDLTLMAIAGWLVFAERFFGFAGPWLGALCVACLVALAPALRPLGGWAGRAVERRWGLAATRIAAFLLLGAGTVGMALVPAYGTVGTLAVGLVVLCRCAQGLALGACADAAGTGPSSAPGWVGGLAGVALASALFAALAASLTGPDFRAWGWQYPFFAVVPIHLVALFARLRCG